MSNIEDSYLKNYEQRPKTKYNNQKSYAVKGEKLPLFAVGIMHGHIDVKELLAICREKQVSITQYFSAVLIWSIYNECLGRKTQSPTYHVDHTGKSSSSLSVQQQ